MSGYIIAGIMIVLTIFVMMARMNLKRWLGYANVVDVTFTIVMLYLFHGTYGGVVAASFAGVFMSLSLTLMRKVLGYDHVIVTRTVWYKGWLRLTWIHVPAVGIRSNLLATIARIIGGYRDHIPAR